MTSDEDSLARLKALAAELEQPALTPGLIHRTLRELVEEAIASRSRPVDGGEF